MKRTRRQKNGVRESNPVGGHRSKAANRGAEEPQKDDLAVGLWEQRLKATLNCVADAVITVDSAGVIVGANGLIADLLGCQPAEIVGRKLQDLDWVDLEHAVEAARHDVSGDTVFRRPVRMKALVAHKNGRTLPVEARAAAVEDSGGCCEVVCALRSVGEGSEMRKRLDEATVRQAGVLENDCDAAFVSDCHRHSDARGTAECRHAYEALWQSEERYRSIFENAVLGIYRTTPDGKILAANPALLRMLGFDDMAELAVRDLEHEGFEPGYPRLAFKQRIEADGEVIALESAWQRRDGTTLWVRENARAIRNEAGEVVFYEGTVEDVTRHKKVEEALLESERRLQATIDAADLGIWEWDMRTQTVRTGGHHERLLGFAPGEFDGSAQTFYDRVHPEDLHILVEATAEAEEKGIDCCTEFRVIWPDGSIHWLAGRGRCQWDQDGQPTRMLGAFQDITERKRSEDALRQSEGRFRELFHNMTSAAAIYEAVDGGQDFIFKDCNRAAEDMAQVKRDDIAGKRLTEVFPAAGRAGVLAVFQKVWRSGRPAHVPETRYEDGRLSFWMEHRLYKLSCGEIVSIWDDVTLRKEAEQRVIRYQDKLKALTTELSLAEERERRRIGVGLHDHVGQALVMTKFSLQALSMKTDAPTTEALRAICSQIDELVDEIRSLSFELSDSVLYEVGLPEAVEAYLVRKLKTKHGLACNLESEGDFSKLDDNMKIVLFRNLRELLTNVIKHAEAEQVWVRLRMLEEEIVVEVEDDGAGFRADALAGTTVDRHKHFGLFSVREQLACFGGRLEIRSNPHRGACVTMATSLPSRL